MRRHPIRGLTLLAALVAASGCQDLVVVNTNDPDRFRAASDPIIVEALLAGAWQDYWGSITGTGGGITLFPVLATEEEYTNIAGAITSEAAEPRQAHANLVSIAASIGAHGPRTHYGNMLEVWSLGDDFLRVAYAPGTNPGGLVIDTGAGTEEDPEDQTPRARAFAYLVSGLALGQLANMYEDVIAIRPTEVFPQTEEDALAYFRDSDETLEIAIENLLAARQLLIDNPNISYPDFTTTGTGVWFGTPTAVGPTELVPFINTMIAHFIIMQARNPAERAAVDWDEVLSYTDEGVTTDFVLQLANNRSSSLYSILQRTSNPFALDNRLVGQADTSGAYQAWIAADLNDRAAFLIYSPDKRIVGDGLFDYDPSTGGVNLQQERGEYTRRSLGNTCCANGGSYRESSYQWRRHAHINNQVNGTGNTNGTIGVAVVASADQNNLYAAEAHFHKGELQDAADLINITRTRDRRAGIDGTMTAGLPGLIAVTVDGAPHDPGIGDNSCVPRTDAGECGDLHVALRYERMVELIGLDITRGFFDSRAFGLLPEDTWTELPMPAPELEQLGFDVSLIDFAFAGGADDPTAAVYAPVGSGWDGVP